MKKYSLILVFLLLAACSTAKYSAPCITSDYENFTLTWGYDYQENDKIMAYQINSNGKLLFFQQDRQTKQKNTDTLANIEPEHLCKILEQTNAAYIKTPALNEPGKRLSFIELSKPAVKFMSRAKWNEFNTYGSQGFRALFDTLSTLVSSKIIKKN